MTVKKAVNSFRDPTKYSVWTLRCEDPVGLQQARVVMVDLAAAVVQGRKNVVDFDGMVPFDGGFALVWRSPARKAAAHNWFQQHMASVVRG